MEQKIINKAIIFRLFYILLISFFKIFASEIACPRDKPILKSGECYLVYCTNEQFNSEECKIANEQIKTQWINNFVQFGGDKFRFLSMSTSSSGDLIVESTAYPKSEIRYFYGLKKNGRPYFINKTTGEETPFYSKITEKEPGQYELESIIIKSSGVNDNGKEYFMSFSKMEGKAEIFDFENDKIAFKTLEVFSGIEEARSYRKALLPLDHYNNKYYYLYGFVGGPSNSDNHIYFKNFSLSSFDNLGVQIKDYVDVIKGYGKDLSCFKTISEKIICFYLTSINSKVYFNIHSFSNNENYAFESNDDETKLFYKCIHLKEEIGVFASFYKYSDVIFPFFVFKEFKNDKFQDYLSNIYPNSTILIQKSDYSDSLSFTDLIRIDDDKIVFMSSSKSKEVLYIIVFNLFGEKQVKIRYYSIQIFALIQRKIFKDLRIHNYNNFVACGISYCLVSKCDTDDTDTHYSAIMLFSYPNSKDETLYLQDYIYNDNSLDLLNLKVNISKQLNFENNIFGYVLSSIYIVKIEGESQNYKAYSSKDEIVEIKVNYSMGIDEYIIFKYLGEENYLPTINKEIQYYFIATEPDYDLFEAYPYEVGGENDQNEFIKKEYNGRYSYYYIKLDNELSSDCTDKNCYICKKESKSFCLTCRYNYTLSENIGKECQQPEEIETTNIMTTEIINKILTEKAEISCSKIDLLNNKCDGQLSEEQVSQLYNQLKNEILNSNYKGNNTIIQTQNVVIQISTLKDQLNSDNPNVSSIDLSDCEQELKSHYKITEDLIVFKIDMKSEDLTQTYVQYEVYDPNNLTKPLNLSVCKDKKISISTPVNLDSSISDLYDNLKDSGYNLFNESDPFYTDICSTYTSTNGTDMTLADRKQEIFSTSGNKSLCQMGCDLEYYNSTSKKAKCECSPQVEETEPILSISSSKFDIKKIGDDFMRTIKNSNFLVLKCYKLAIDLKSLMINYGRIMMTIILFFSLITSSIYCINDRKTLDVYIASIVKKNMCDINNNNNNNKVKEKKKLPKNKSKFYKSECKKGSGKKKLIPSNSNQSYSQSNILRIKNKLKLVPPKKKISERNKKQNLKEELNRKNSTIRPLKKSSSTINYVKINNYNIKNFVKRKRNKSKSLIPCSPKNTQNNSISKSKRKMKLDNMNYASVKDSIHLKTSNKNIGKSINNLLTNYYNDEELNTLEYELAILVDKRTYFQYYWSLIKKKQLILFTFLRADDYNLMTIKICLFLLSFSLYFTVNGFFFSDDTMHKIHEDHGKFNFIYQIPQILFSSVVSAIINMILKQLSLSEKNIIELKKETDIIKMKNNSKDIRRCILIKFIIFFLLNIILLLFFWYFISCFCAVYKNTQIILIKDTLISFGISMLYPFGLNLLPGMFRLPALGAQNKDKKCLYIFSTLVALF